MSYLVLARKWRPQTFEDVVGQAHVTRTLANAIETDRVAHAFVFSGVRGCGKTSLARILAKSLNCAQGPTKTPCGVCESCQSITSGRAVDVIEIDGASNNSVEDIRQLRETVPYRPVIGRFKIYVIDEVHMLSVSAFNALLKTLEEPPPHVKFIFATTEPHKIPVTILSRCQRYDFRRIPTAAIIERIGKILDSDGIKADEAALVLIGREAEGSMRDALSILDQVLAAGASELTGEMVAGLLGMVERRVLYDLSEALLASDARRCLEVVQEVDRQGLDMVTFGRALLEHLRNLVVAGVCGGDQAVLDLPREEIDDLVAQAGRVTKDTLHRNFKHFSESYESIARSTHPKILMEATLARLADLGELLPAADILKRLEDLAARGGLARPAAGSGGGGGATSSRNVGDAPEAGVGDAGVRTAPRSGPERAPTPAPVPAPVAPSGAAPPEAGPTPVVVQEISRRPMEEAPWAPAPSPSAQKRTPQRPLPPPQQWGPVLAGLQRKFPSLASILECGVPRVDDDGFGVTFCFPGDYAAVAALARDRLADIAGCLSEHVEGDVRVDVAVEQTGDVPVMTKRRLEREEESRRREEEARQHPLVRGTIVEFGGTVTKISVETAPVNVS